MLDHREFTLILYVTDIVGMLARVLDVISKLELSVLTIHQSIPMEEKATITLSLNAKSKRCYWRFEKLDYVSKVELISMSMWILPIMYAYVKGKLTHLYPTRSC